MQKKKISCKTLRQNVNIRTDAHTKAHTPGPTDGRTD